MRTKIFLTLLTLINLLLFACGNSSGASASGGYRYEILFGVHCITNDVSISCDWN